MITGNGNEMGLIVASKEGLIEMVRRLIENGADLEVVDGEGGNLGLGGICRKAQGRGAENALRD